jgi:hypothetical protein
VDALLQGDEGGNRLPFDLVGPLDDGGFGDSRVIDQRALDFHRADSVARDVEDVVHAAEQPVTAVLEAGRRIQRACGRP